MRYPVVAVFSTHLYVVPVFLVLIVAMDDFGFGSANNGEPDEVQDFLAREQQQFAELHGGTEEQSVVNSDFGASNVNEVNC